MIKLALNPDDSIKVPADTEKTGWWSGGAKPGRKGAAVIVGHVDSQSGPAVFHDLGRLASGDKVRVIHKDGPRATFVVTRRERVPKQVPNGQGLQRHPTSHDQAHHLRRRVRRP